MPRKIWVLEKFAQIVMTVSQITWCRGCEEALKSAKPKDAMRKWLAIQKSQLAGCSKTIKNVKKCLFFHFQFLTYFNYFSECSKLVAGNLSSINRKKLVTLITTDVHARDVTQTLISKGVGTC